MFHTVPNLFLPRILYTADHSRCLNFWHPSVGGTAQCVPWVWSPDPWLRGSHLCQLFARLFVDQLLFVVGFNPPQILSFLFNSHRVLTTAIDQIDRLSNVNWNFPSLCHPCRQTCICSWGRTWISLSIWSNFGNELEYQWSFWYLIVRDATTEWYVISPPVYSLITFVLKRN